MGRADGCIRICSSSLRSELRPSKHTHQLSPYYFFGDSHCPIFLGGGGVWFESEVLSKAKMSVKLHPAATQKNSDKQNKQKKTALNKQNGFLETGSKRINA